MSLDSLGFGIRRVLRRNGNNVEHVLTQRPLQRVLAFTGHSIDDLVNSQIVKNKVAGYYRLYRQVERGSDIRELERQWNG
jgi:hypothetical protein